MQPKENGDKHRGRKIVALIFSASIITGIILAGNGPRLNPSTQGGIIQGERPEIFLSPKQKRGLLENAFLSVFDLDTSEHSRELLPHIRNLLDGTNPYRVSTSVRIGRPSPGESESSASESSASESTAMDYTNIVHSTYRNMDNDGDGSSIEPNDEIEIEVGDLNEILRDPKILLTEHNADLIIASLVSNTKEENDRLARFTEALGATDGRVAEVLDDLLPAANWSVAFSESLLSIFAVIIPNEKGFELPAHVTDHFTITLTDPNGRQEKIRVTIGNTASIQDGLESSVSLETPDALSLNEQQKESITEAVEEVFDLVYQSGLEDLFREKSSGEQTESEDE